MDKADLEQHDRFLRLFMEQEEALRLFVRSLLFSQEETREVMQEVAIVLWRKFDDSLDSTAFRRWAFGVARMEALTFRRDRARDRHTFGDDIAQLLEHRGRGGPEPRRPVYKNTETGQTVPIAWSYVGAKYALEPTLTAPEVPSPSKYVAVLPARQRMVVELGNRLPDKGTMRVRFRAARVSTGTSDAPKLALEFGWQGDKDQRAAYRVSSTLRVIDASPDKPALYQFDIPLAEVHPRNPARKTEELGFKDRTNPSEYIRFYNASTGEAADVQIDYVEVSAPLYETWPPDSHSAIFVDNENGDDEDAYAREIVSRFMRRAWRRNVTETEVDSQMELFTQLRPICNDFEHAVVETLAAVLSSPRFLYQVQYRGGWKPGDTEPWRIGATYEDVPLSNLFVTMLQRLGVESETFADNTGTVSEV